MSVTLLYIPSKQTQAILAHSFSMYFFEHGLHSHAFMDTYFSSFMSLLNYHLLREMSFVHDMFHSFNHYSITISSAILINVDDTLFMFSDIIIS